MCCPRAICTLFICTCFLGVRCLKQVITLKSSPLPQGGQFFSWRDLARDNSKNTDEKHRQIYQLVQNFHLYGGTFIFSQPLVWLNGLQDLINLPDSWLGRSEATIQILAIPPAAPELLVISTTFIILTFIIYRALLKTGNLSYNQFLLHILYIFCYVMHLSYIFLTYFHFLSLDL